MADDLERVLAESRADAVVVRAFPALSAWVFIALDDLTPGIGVGGTRLRAYDSPAAGLRDALRLATGMTRKWAALGLPKGGAKGVIALGRPLEPEERTRLLEEYGALVEGLRGTFGTGPDLGITAADLRTIASRTAYVHGLHPDGSIEDAGPYTAHGVRSSIEVALEAVETPGLAGRSIWIDGVGSVGGNLARMLAPEGARLHLTDLDVDKARVLAAELGVESSTPDAALDGEWDVFAPCAIGGVLDADLVERLRARIVAGAANDQLATGVAGDRLHERGILYCPDFIVNGGAAIALTEFGVGTTDRSLLMRQVESIGARLRTLLAEARANGEAPFRVARRWVEGQGGEGSRHGE